MKARITKEHSLKIQSFLSGEKIFTWQDILSLLDNIYTLDQIKYHANKYYPELKKNIKKEYSKGNTKLEYLLKNIFSYDKIKKEYQIGEKLRVDFVITHPYNIAIEFDGIQHSEFNSHFYEDRSAFNNAIERDSRKEFLCQKQGLSFLRISELDIDETSLRNLLQQVGNGSGIVDPNYLSREQKIEQYKKQTKLKQKKAYNNPIKKTLSEEQKEKMKKLRKEQYLKAKEWKKKNKKK